MEIVDRKEQKANDIKQLSLSQRQEFINLPIEERRRILEQQANQIQDHYQEDIQWREWLEGDILDY
jgi:hypothetical protein